MPSGRGKKVERAADWGEGLSKPGDQKTSNRSCCVVFVGCYVQCLPGEEARVPAKALATTDLSVSVDLPFTFRVCAITARKPGLGYPGSRALGLEVADLQARLL